MGVDDGGIAHFPFAQLKDVSSLTILLSIDWINRL